MEQHLEWASDPEFPSAGESRWCNGAGSSDKASCVSLSLLLLRKIDLDMDASDCDLLSSQGAIPFVMIEVLSETKRSKTEELASETAERVKESRRVMLNGNNVCWLSGRGFF